MIVTNTSVSFARLPETHQLRKWLERVRWQLGLGLLLCVGIPSILRYYLTSLPITISTEFNSFVASVFAISGGYAFLRRLHLFPGISAIGYVMPCFSAAFGAVAIVMFTLRLDYSRMPLFISYLMSLAWFGLIFLVVYRDKILNIAVVPGGDAEGIERIKHVRWQVLQSPADVPTGFDAIVVDLNAENPDEWERFIADQALSGVPVYDVKQAVEQITGRAEIDRLSRNTLGSINPNEVYHKLKQAAEWVAAACALVALMPFFAIIALAIKLDSPGPIFFRQHRVGFRAVPFRVFKFRTMVDRADAPVADARQAAITLSGDARITRVGALLRRTRLDELPQILNVLAGDMGWIGPRPEAVPLTQWYEKELPFYHYRHIVRPGITGWAQVMQGHVADVSDVQEKLYYDFYYIKNYSFWLDVLIVMMTVKIVLTGHGAK